MREPVSGTPTEGLRAGSPRPRDVLQAAEDGAVRLRKLLQQLTSQRSASASSEPIGDAVKLARLVEDLASYGRNLPAAEAIDLAGKVEFLLDELRAKVDALLAP